MDEDGSREVILKQIWKQIKCEFLGLWTWVHEVQMESNSESKSYQNKIEFYYIVSKLK